MDVHNLGRIFNPKRIALVGVTQNPNSVGGKVLGNLVAGGFGGSADFDSFGGRPTSRPRPARHR